MIIQWITVLGIVGFLSGFVGPMLLAPDANQGPMLGIFITGPGGAVLGAVLGSIVGMIGWASSRNRQALYICATLLAVVTLYFCIPSPRYRADVVEGDILTCTVADSLREKTIDSLNKTTAGRPNQKPIKWDEKFDLAIAEKPGVIIVLHIARFTKGFEKQALWNRGELMMELWRSIDKDVSYFAHYAGNDCSQYPVGMHTTLTATGNIGIWPPYGTAEMLNVKTVEPLTEKYVKHLADQERSH